MSKQYPKHRTPGVEAGIAQHGLNLECSLEWSCWVGENPWRANPLLLFKVRLLDDPPPPVPQSGTRFRWQQDGGLHVSLINAKPLAERGLEDVALRVAQASPFRGQVYFSWINPRTHVGWLDEQRNPGLLTQDVRALITGAWGYWPGAHISF